MCLPDTAPPNGLLCRTVSDQPDKLIVAQYIGKPEALRGDLTGYWSKRIDDVNRLVYQATDTELKIYACRFHYGDK